MSDSLTHRRVTLFAGHYGSGKTNIAVNWALALRKSGAPVTIVDLDIVNPYFRTKDSKADLDAAGVELISSPYANSNVDFPALPQEIYGAVERHDRLAVLDIGGDDRGALALGRYAPYILEENDFEMLFVANCFRPLTRTPQETLEVLREIEAAGGIPFTGIVNNSNLGNDTTAEDILAAQDYAAELCALCKLPLRLNTVKETLMPQLTGRVPNLFPLRLQAKYYE
ncbi:MAG: hypothetical protein ACI3VU_01125 [Faecousia sp.]